MAKLLGFDIFDGSREEYMERLMNKYTEGEKTIIASGNPEVLYCAAANDDVKSVLHGSDIIPDGIGTVIAGRITGQPFKQKIAGIEILEEILKISGESKISVYMLGAEDWVVEKAVKSAREKYNANICGYHDGFFNLEDCGEILDDINKCSPGVLLVAMGCPRQEVFIQKYKDILCSKIFMTVGGSFDVLAGKAKRAPLWMINLGLEWLYRVIKEPFRLKRLASIPKFLIKVMLKGR